MMSARETREKEKERARETVITAVTETAITTAKETITTATTSGQRQKMS